MVNNLWSEEQIIIAFALYCQMPYGRIHSRNPKIIEVAKKIGRTPNALAMKMLNIASLDPKIIESGRAGLGNASTADRRIWEQFHEDWDTAFQKAEIYLTDEEEVSPEEVESADTESVREVTQRRKQAFFRNSILAGYGEKCCISGLSHRDLLVPGHIVPWSEDRKNRLNPQNGLCMSVLYDKMFDIGWLTVTPNYEVVISETFKNEAKDEFSRLNLHSVHGQKIMLPEKFVPSREFLEYHNERKFRS